MSEEPFVPPEEVGAITFRVSAEEAGERLDAYLAARVASLSRTTIKRAIEDGDALVDGRIAKPSYKLRGGEEIELDAIAPPALELTPEDITLEIVHEDEEVVVVNKPAGMVVHPAAGVAGGTLANALAHHFQKLPARGGDLRPGIVHRLDRGTSGLIVVAKTAQAHENLSEQFRAREVFKSYAALVHGVVKEDRGRIEEPLGRDTRKRTRMAVRAGGRAALTLWRVRKRFARMSLLEVEIKTGRTHQIRVHMAWMKHPVVGDEMYGGGRDTNIQDARLRSLIAALGRPFLHARRIGFRHPRTAEWMSFDAPLPSELQKFLDELESAA